MPKTFVPGRVIHQKQLSSFTLVELLVVIAIIAILAALVLFAGSGALNVASRKRSASEIQAMTTALESYKTDNGIYPPVSTAVAAVFTTNNYAVYDPSKAGDIYWQSSQTLYEALSGQTNFLDTPVSGIKSYMQFKANQLGNTTTASGTGINASSSTYVKDPWNYSYGYSTANTGTQTPYNGTGFFDLWSTGGNIGGSGTVETNTASWISNWQ